MVAKGLDFEKVTLVGVLGIDSLLFGQGFRAYERVQPYHPGRGPRRAPALPGRALIQTSVPDHPVLQLAAAQDYKGFYREEITFRRFSLYPPFCSFVVVGFIGDQEGPCSSQPSGLAHCWVSTPHKAQYPAAHFRPRADEHYDAQQQISLQADAEMPQ